MPSGSVGVIEAHLAVEDVKHVLEVPRPAGVARERPKLGLGAHVPLDVGAGVGQQGFEDGPGGLLVVLVLGRRAAAALKVSSRKVAPTPRVPPTPRKEAGVQGRSFIIWANRARRTQITFPS